MTPPKKKPKYEELVITEYSEKFKTKPEQIVCSQSSQSHHAVITPNEIGRRLAEVSKEKKK